MPREPGVCRGVETRGLDTSDSTRLVYRGVIFVFGLEILHRYLNLLLVKTF